MRKPTASSSPVVLNMDPLLPGLEVASAAKLEFTRINAFPVAKLPVPKGGKEPSRELIDGIRKIGQVILPVICYDTGGDKGQLVIRDGLRRIKAALALGISTVPLVIVHGSACAGAVIGIAANEMRSGNPASELIMVRELINAGASEDGIVATTGLSQPRLRKLLRLTALNTSIYKEFESGAVSPAIAQRVAKLNRDDQEKLATVMKDHGRLTSRDVDAVRKVQVGEQMEALPDSAFAPAPAAWEPRVHRLLCEALSQIPAGEIREQLDAIAQRLASVPAAAA